ncbi:hypothetical protein [Nocardioides sp.]|uniref:hypothetical protein n=1 Tax=Nocardioides sp. TaxID=35761 RepID=UPI00261C8BA5|nr:hypothetical protein [Nocardioides sp.]MDI6912491.1 hypothetical protein [Nocardioides sp.]
MTIVDRLKDVIITGGRNGYSEKYGENVAIVVPREGATITLENLRDYGTRHLSSDKLPRELVVDEIPETRRARSLSTASERSSMPDAPRPQGSDSTLKEPVTPQTLRLKVWWPARHDRVRQAETPQRAESQIGAGPRLRLRHRQRDGQFTQVFPCVGLAIDLWPAGSCCDSSGCEWPRTCAPRPARRRSGGGADRTHHSLRPARASTKHLLDATWNRNPRRRLGARAEAQVANVSTPEFPQALNTFRTHHKGATS